VKIEQFDPNAPNFTATYDQPDTLTPVSAIRNVKEMAMTFTLVQRSANLEPLTMLINPEDMSFKKSKINSSTFTRRGWSVDQWGDELDKITCSGYSGGFYTLEYGLTRKYMKSSAAYKYFMALLLLYKNNGIAYTSIFNTETFRNRYGRTPQGLKDRVQGTEVNPPINKSIGGRTYPRPHTIGYVQMTYDGFTYYGSFDYFNFEENVDTPFMLKYDFGFTIRGEDPGKFGGHFYTGNIA